MRLPFDQYDLSARIYPALIVSLPVLVVVYSAAPTMKNPLGTAAFGTLLEVAVLYFLGRIARDRGFKLQPRLYDRWGGKPTTCIMRSDNYLIDPTTKVRLKASIRTLCGVDLPTVEEERADPGRADELHASAISALLEHRRGKDFSLVFKENCNYGFARNLYGIRWFGIVVAALCLGADAALFRMNGAFFLLAVSTLTSIIVLLLLLFYVNEGFVKRSAEAYAIALLRSCEPHKAKRAVRKKTTTELL